MSLPFLSLPGEELLAVLELLREELVQLVGNLEEVGRRRLGDHHLQLVPREVAPQEDLQGRHSVMSWDFTTAIASL